LDSFQHSIFVILTEFISFLLSLLIGFRFYKYLSNLLIVNFSLPVVFSKAIGFVIVVIVAEAILASVIFFFVRKIPEKIRKDRILNYFRFIVGLFDGILFLSFVIPLTLAFPLPSFIKENIDSSKLGGYLGNYTSVFEKRYSDIFGGIIDEGLNLVTINPGSDKRISLKVLDNNLTIDYGNERSMLNLINLERQKAGVSKLTWREETAKVARDYAVDMWRRGYFSHYSPEGEDISGRLEEAGIDFRVVGENLALAPTLLIAHTGLMNSQGHKQNILDPSFKQVAIGVIDNGINGKIFVQIFTD
jgi:hypothetical protein